jgi:RNAse (barnase) inhibitor barstar
MSVSNESNYYLINGNLIKNMDDFGSLFAKVCNFPDYYGKNMDAWIDCMRDLLIKENITIELQNFTDFNRLFPKISNNLLDCICILNQENSHKICLVLS